jgi:hypothetical protein
METDTATLIDGYVITHPHDPYEGVAEIHINRFAAGAEPWHAQSYVNGSLVDAAYFATEIDALRWAAREMTLIASVAKHDAEAMREGLETIRDRHIPDQPSAFGGSELDWAARQHGALRDIARKTLATP